ncbi:hypothetical protein ALI144C_10095 [Actinosynnema sp. ALI-1.44]|uniref:TfuA-like protein n=1 Tax=Actinosynnema sp. ALI-1.44 TaxID=1933779 RepID=UPI00097C0721|nr:TfuA-like protein [Actinosynnema sp. ALI-1.44]ONI86985.1 hypothetical protein ALI144C_10095 [Actinosynnema sp. ALI-1.44]
MRVHVFLGPTLPGRDALRILPEALVHPPAAHGDMLRLDCAAGDVVLLVDGYYHHSASVRHKEILALLSEGVHVVGCASMGALRAAELHQCGMVGNGIVFGMYRDGVIDCDDEVAVKHTEGPEYRKLTVPSVAIRHAAASARLSGLLSEPDERGIIGIARSLHYTDRSWQAVEVSAQRDGLADQVARLRSSMAGQPDVKALDTVDTLTKIARRELPGAGRPGEWVSSPDWRTGFLADWQAEFSVTTVEGVEVGTGAVARFQQIYLADFPTRWERLVLSTVAGPGDDLVPRALAAAARLGLTPESITAAQAEYWLTAAERAELSGADAVIRLLVRSHKAPAPARRIAGFDPGVVADPAARRAVAEAQVTNARVASWKNGQSIAHLNSDVLRAHLAEVWRAEGSAALTAAARDRGFDSVDAAVAAVRPFFLRTRLLTGVRAD